MTPRATDSPRSIIRVYLTLTLFNTLAASLIWGIDTLFLLNAGLNLTEVFIVNAFFTAGMVLFEIPTGVIADTRGRRLSYMLGTVTLALSTVLYVVFGLLHAPFIFWLIGAVGLGLGFTFFSGATEAWLVDALKAVKYNGHLEKVFGQAQTVGGVAMLLGAIAGGLIAQVSSLEVPYVIRAILLVVTFVIAGIYMRDLGFKPEKAASFVREARRILHASIQFGFKNVSVRWVMLAAPFTAGVGIYVFYALQPYLLDLYGDQTAYWIAGLVAAIVAGARIVGGLMVPLVRRLFTRRTTVLIIGTLLSGIILALIGLMPTFYAVIFLIVLWALISAATTPVRQAFLNDLIPSKQRATVLSFDSLLGSGGGVVIQPVLGKVGDMWNYGTSYVVSGGIQLLALPFLLLASRQSKAADKKISDQEN